MPSSFRLSLQLAAAAVLAASGLVADAQQLTETNYDQLVPQGKEVDAIYDDFAIRNKSARAIVAFPAVTRNSNMTVRSVGGCLIDLAAAAGESDQLSAFYPGRRKFPFSEVQADDGAVVVSSPGSDKLPECTVRYEFSDDQPILSVTSTWTNTTGSDWTLALEDDLRADGGKEDMVKTPNGINDLFYFHDIYWQQAYGFRAEGYRIRSNSGSRDCVLNYEPVDGKPIIIKPGKSFSFTRQIIVAKDLPEVLAVHEETTGGQAAQAVSIEITDSMGQGIANARVAIVTGETKRGTTVTDEAGFAAVRLPLGSATLDASVAGVSLFAAGAVTLNVVDGVNEFVLQSEYQQGTVAAQITDGDGRPIPAKVEFIGNGDTATPNWGPDSGEHFIRNLAYTASGDFETPLAAGEYDVIVSHGVEYDAVFTKVSVAAGQTAELKAALKHSVKTPGWVSADFHSHSSPSGDNTGSQRGRVLNLAAEHIEFAPCTEHNRISTYDGHIAELGLKPFLATVSGMELTGSPLPLNHQNVFPLKHSPRTQDGGGPVTDGSPESQMERVAYWDDRSEKLIQQNHPDIGWLFYDKNGDGTLDEGYSRSFSLMDVMEIHPIDRILKLERYDIRSGKAFNNQRMLNWLQLLNQGHRIYGVVNTDAHYNYHGSGGLRNWIQSTTDAPAEIDFMEMVHASEQGRLIMSNGPYLEATFTAADSGQTVVSGQDLEAGSGKVTAHIRVQCPNWIDIDTVFVLINGRVVEELQFTREATADRFTDDVVKFDQKIDIQLEQDAHIVVVTGHRTEVLGDVQGPSWGAQHPAALTNPVFVDVDGNGFAPNKDTLGYPLPVKFGTEK